MQQNTWDTWFDTLVKGKTMMKTGSLPGMDARLLTICSSPTEFFSGSGFPSGLLTRCHDIVLLWTHFFFFFLSPRSYSRVLGSSALSLFNPIHIIHFYMAGWWTFDGLQYVSLTPYDFAWYGLRITRYDSSLLTMTRLYLLRLVLTHFNLSLLIETRLYLP